MTEEKEESEQVVGWWERKKDIRNDTRRKIIEKLGWIRIRNEGNEEEVEEDKEIMKEVKNRRTSEIKEGEKGRCFVRVPSE